MIYTVTFNPALDYTMKVNNLVIGEINRSESEEVHYGGKGINVSAILSRLGIDNQALGFLAGFSGEKLKNMLCDDGIENDFIMLKNGSTRINVKVKAEKELDINACGPSIEDDELEMLFDKLEQINNGDALVLAGSIPKSLPNDIYEKILEKLNNRGIMTVVDATGDLLLNVLSFKPFLIKPNHHELGEIFSKEINNLDEIIKYSRMLQEKGARNVLVSRGKDGAVLICENGTVYTEGNVPGKIVSSVGCGDSMVAGFLAGYIQNGDYSNALHLGSACGNATAFSPSLATKNQIDEMLESEYLGVNIYENC